MHHPQRCDVGLTSALVREHAAAFFESGRSVGFLSTSPFEICVMLVIFGLLVAIGVAYGILEIVSGWFISRRRRRVFSFVVALPRLLLLPYGLILSIFTLLVLERASVKQLYRAQSGL